MSVNPFIGAYRDATPTWEERQAKQTNMANIGFQDRLAQVTNPYQECLTLRVILWVKV